MAINNLLTRLHCRCPCPTLRQFAKARDVCGFWLLVLSLPRPFRPPLLKNLLQKLLAGFVGAAFTAGQGSFGSYEAAFNDGFEDVGFAT